MRIRKNASRLLGSSNSVSAAPALDAAHPFEPPTPAVSAPFMAPESLAGSSFSVLATASVETCELSRNPWDLIADLSISDPQVEKDLLDKYMVSVPSRANWLSTANMPVASVTEKQVEALGAGTTSQPRQKLLKKAPKKLAVSKKESEFKKSKVNKQPTYKCKRSDGKRWQCSRPVSSPNSLCDYHFHMRAYPNSKFATLVAAEAKAKKELKVPQPAAASKPATRSKPRKRPGQDLAVTEGFYYYGGFSPARSKRQCRSSGMKHDGEDEHAEDVSLSNQQAPAAADCPVNKVAAHEDASSCNDDITGGDEDSSNASYRLDGSGRNMNGNGEHRHGKRKKLWRKPVKERSLKSLM